jgi:hypothetical protein
MFMDVLQFLLEVSISRPGTGNHERDMLFKKRSHDPCPGFAIAMLIDPPIQVCGKAGVMLGLPLRIIQVANLFLKV